jgi:branched-chain amino acid transport system permease protein
VINFSQGQLMMLAAFAMTTCLALLRGSWWLALIAVLPIMALLGILMYALALRFLMGAAEFPRLVVTFMLAIIFTQAAGILWGTNVRQIPAPFSAKVDVFGAGVRIADLAYLGLTAAIVVALVCLLSFTTLGIRLRALASNELLAIYGGVRVHQLAAAAWGVSAALAALGGVIVGERLGVSIQLADIGLAAFPAAIIGGIRSPGGSMVGALLTAIVQVLVTLRFSAQVAEVVLYVILLGFVAARPYGLFGSPMKRRL